MKFTDVLINVAQEATSDEVAIACMAQYMTQSGLLKSKQAPKNPTTWNSNFVREPDRYHNCNDGSIAALFLKLVGAMKPGIRKGTMRVSPRVLLSMFGYSPQQLPWKLNTPPSVATMFADGSIIVIEHPNTKEVNPTWRRVNSAQEASTIRYNLLEAGITKETPPIR